MEQTLKTSGGVRQELEKRPQILVINYECHPNLGSESAIGWGLVRTISEFADCVVLTSPHNIDVIRHWETETSNQAVTFVEVPESRLAPWLNWHRVAWFIGYTFWNRNAGRIATQIISEKAFDAVFHATISAYWLPSSTANLGIPCIWGPVGGAVTSPIQLWPVLGLKGIFDELLDLVCVRISSWLPATRRTWRSVTRGLVNNEKTWAKLPKYLQERSQIMNHVLFIESPQVSPRQRKSHILYFSPLESRKGPRLAIYSLCYTPENVRLRIVGNGPEIQTLKRLIQKLKVAHRVDFLYQLPRKEAHAQVAEAAAVVFTGMREEGGASLAETMLIGTPVIVLANGGARTVANSHIDSERVVLVEPAKIKLTAQLFGEAMTRFSEKPTLRHDPNLDQETARRQLKSVFQSVIMETK